jgi:hypothetical protein
MRVAHFVTMLPLGATARMEIAEDGTTHLTLRSGVQIKEQASVPFLILFPVGGMVAPPTGHGLVWVPVVCVKNHTL